MTNTGMGMDSLLLKLGLLLALPLLVACAAGPAQQQVALPLLHFQKTPCLGRCPSYEATVYTNGQIRYKGYEHTALSDTATMVFGKADLDALKTELEALQAMPLQDAYLTQWSDMPSTYTTFYQNGKETKRVKHQEGGPEALLQFQEKLHQKLMQLAEAEAQRRLPRY